MKFKLNEPQLANATYGNNSEGKSTLSYAPGQLKSPVGPIGPPSGTLLRCDEETWCIGGGQLAQNAPRCVKCGKKK